MKRLTSLLAAVLWTAAEAGLAHPLGNSTVNRWVQLDVSVSGIALDYVLDLAELPTLVESSAADRDGDGQVSAQEWSAYTRAWAQRLSGELQVTLDGQRLALQPERADFVKRDGEAGLTIVRLEASLRAAFPEGASGRTATLGYRDATQVSGLGWKEVVLRAGQGAQVRASSLPGEDRSQRLSAFGATTRGDYPDVTSGQATLALTRSTVQAAPRTAPSKAQSGSGNRGSEQPSGTPVPTTLSADQHADLPVQAMLESEKTGKSSFLGYYFRLGMHHIATGWDHVLFLFGLLLLRLPMRRTIGIVTAFTLAHSLTLGAAAAGWITPPSTWIEPLIALTIAYVGLLNVIKKGERRSVVLAFGFGLVHGFGFAGALAESAAGHALKGRDLLLSLAGFNLGIESMQLLVVLIIVPPLAFCARQVWFASAERLAGGALILVGVGVFVSRLSGGSL